MRKPIGKFTILFLMPFSLVSCTKSHQYVLSEPHSAEIYWGETQDGLKKSPYTTPYSDSISGRLESWCFQVKKVGYHASKVICRRPEEYRLIEFRLVPLKTAITSEPEFATIFWGPSRDKIEETIFKTPHTEENVSRGASWNNWYFQVKKEGYYDSEFFFSPRALEDREVHFVLTPLSSGKATLSSSGKVTLGWEDKSSNELGFEIERKIGSRGAFHKIATVGPNVTGYTDTGLHRGETYYYRVRAYNSQGHSPHSEEIRVVLPAQESN